MYPQQRRSPSQFEVVERTSDSDVVCSSHSHSSKASSVLTRVKSEEENKEFDSVENFEIEFDPGDEICNEDPDKGIMESLMEHIEENAKNISIAINNEVDMLILALNERRKELLVEVAAERERKINRLRNKRRNYARSFCKDVSKENLGDDHRYRSNDDSILDTQRDARTVENLRPLQCGDLRLVCESSVYETVRAFGKIESSLASGVHSEAMGLGLSYSFIGEEASFNVVTRDNTMKKTFSGHDNIKVVVHGPAGQVITALINTKNSGVHTVKYIPTVLGYLKIRVFVNKLELIESPFTCEAFSKESLSFEQGELQLPGLDNHDGWVLNKEETSALLESNDQAGALIFGTQCFSGGKHGWKIKFTSACTSVNISIGVSPKTRILDIDIKHTCMFSLDSVNVGYSPRSKSKPRRKLSTFHRESRTFFVLLDMEQEMLTIICMETEERKHINIPMVIRNLYPCVYMVHDCTKNVCPRPLIAFS